jgi:hypothetical protein
VQSLLVEEEKVQKYRNNRNITVAYTEHLRTMPKMTIQVSFNHCLCSNIQLQTPCDDIEWFIGGIKGCSSHYDQCIC